MDWRDAKEGVGSGVLDLAAWRRWMQRENGVPPAPGGILVHAFCHCRLGIKGTNKHAGAHEEVVRRENGVPPAPGGILVSAFCHCQLGIEGTKHAGAQEEVVRRG
jgi:hypothetical protein